MHHVVTDPPGAPEIDDRLALGLEQLEPQALERCGAFLYTAIVGNIEALGEAAAV